MKILLQIFFALFVYLFINNVIVNIGLLFLNSSAFPKLYIIGYVCGGQDSLPTIYLLRCGVMVIIRVISFGLIIKYFSKLSGFLLTFLLFDFICAGAVYSKALWFSMPFFCNYFYYIFSFWLFGNYYFLMLLLGLANMVIAYFLLSRKINLPTLFNRSSSFRNKEFFKKKS